MQEVGVGVRANIKRFGLVALSDRKHVFCCCDIDPEKSNLKV